MTPESIKQAVEHVIGAKVAQPRQGGGSTCSPRRRLADELYKYMLKKHLRYSYPDIARVCKLNTHSTARVHVGNWRRRQERNKILAMKLEQDVLIQLGVF